MLGFRHIAAAAASTEFVLNISSSSVQPNIRALAIAAGWNEATRLVVNITAANINTLSWPGAYPAGRRLIISAGTRIGAEADGGPAITINGPIEIENRGRVMARGGGGGRGGAVTVSYDSDTATATGGFGGVAAGYIPGTTTWRDAGPGESGNVVGVGPSIGPSHAGYGYGGEGGQGGSSGQPGSFGSQASVSGVVHSASYTQPSTPQSGGVAISGSSYVTWVARGTIVGGEV